MKKKATPSLFKKKKILESEWLDYIRKAIKDAEDSLKK